MSEHIEYSCLKVHLPLGKSNQYDTIEDVKYSGYTAGANDMKRGCISFNTGNRKGKINRD